MHPDEALERVNAAFAVGQTSLCVLVGTGLAISATERDPKSSWGGLILHAAGACVRAGGRDDDWFEGVEGDVRRGDFLPAAEKVTDGLGGQDGAEFRRWLREGPGSLTVKQPLMLNALRRLFDSDRVSIVTTNYDDLMSTYFTRDRAPVYPVTLSQPGLAHDAFMGKDRAVVHVHGHWRDPSSIVFGSSSYREILLSTSARTFMQQMLLGRLLLFVGTGAGLEDPNFARLFDWAKDAIPASTEAFLLRAQGNPRLGPATVHDVQVPNYDDVPEWLNRIVLPQPRYARGLGDHDDPGGDNGPGGERQEPRPAVPMAPAAIRRRLEDILRWAADPRPNTQKVEAQRFVALFGEEIASALAGLDESAPAAQRDIALAWGATLLDSWHGFEQSTG